MSMILDERGRYSPAKDFPTIVAFLLPGLVYLYLMGISAWWRSFAKLPGRWFDLPIFITDVILLLMILAVVADIIKRRNLGALWPESQPWIKFIFSAIAALQLITAARLVMDFERYGFQALRDSAMVVYLLFIPLAFYLSPIISLRKCLWSIFWGLCLCMLSWYLINYLRNDSIGFFKWVPNHSIMGLPVIAVLLWNTRWRQFGYAMLGLLAMALSYAVVGKRTFLLGSFLSVLYLLTLSPHCARNLPRLFAAAILSFIMAVGLLQLPTAARPILLDATKLSSLLVQGVQNQLAAVSIPVFFSDDTSDMADGMKEPEIPRQVVPEPVASASPEAAIETDVIYEEGSKEVDVPSEIFKTENVLKVEVTDKPQIAIEKVRTIKQTAPKRTVENTAIEKRFDTQEDVREKAGSRQSKQDDSSRAAARPQESIVPDAGLPAPKRAVASETEMTESEVRPSEKKEKKQIVEAPPPGEMTIKRRARLLRVSDTAYGGLMSWRIYLWKNVINDIKEKPWFGWGFGPRIVKGIPSAPVLTKKFISGPHNAYLSVAFRLGIVLAGVFLIIPLLFFVRVHSRRKSLGLVQILAATVVFYSYINAFFNIGFESPQDSVPAYLLMGLLMYFLCYKASENIDPPENQLFAPA